MVDRLFNSQHAMTSKASGGLSGAFKSRPVPYNLRAGSLGGPASGRLAAFPVFRSPFMAQPSTTYKFELNLTDLDRSVYESVKQIGRASCRERV